MYLEEIQAIPPERLVYIDESGLEENGSSRAYGRAAQGEPVPGAVSGKRSPRISLIAAFTNRQLKAPFRFEGATNTDVFNLWVHQCLVPTLQSGQIVIMDNARFHQSAKTQELIAAAHCQVRFLPPYSPDLNPIEPVWAIVKARIRRDRLPHQPFVKAIDAQLKHVDIL